MPSMTGSVPMKDGGFFVILPISHRFVFTTAKKSDKFLRCAKNHLHFTTSRWENLVKIRHEVAVRTHSM